MDQGSSSSMEELGLQSQEDEPTTVSLADVLSARSGFLVELELWALCRECCLTLEYVHSHVELFQTMHISPDTVAFDTEGNVCFLDLDMEADPMFKAPEIDDNGGNSFKTHLFSLGMTLLVATEYNTRSDDPRAELSDIFTELLASLTNENIDHRPDLYTVLDACDKALGEQQSQEICSRIIEIEHNETSYIKDNEKGTFQNDNDECNKNDLPSNSIHSNHVHSGAKDVNDNCVKAEPQPSRGPASNSLDCEDGAHTQISATVLNQVKKKKMSLGDLLNNLDRYLNEAEVWALCSECIWYLQRKINHLPAYISPDTVVLYQSGKVRFKAANEEKLLEMIYMAPELQQKGTVSEKTCLYGLGKTLQSAVGHKYSSDMEDSETLEILIQALTQTSPDKRPNLETGFEMCQEYKKCNRIDYQTILQKLYKGANQEMTEADTSTQNGGGNFERSSAELQNFSSQQKDKIRTGTSSHTADSTGIEPLSAFKPVSQNKASKSKDNCLSMPPAFSSTATHFKPIVIEPTLFPQTTSGEPSSQQASNKGTAVVEKLKEIKDTMLKHQKAHGDHTAPERSKALSDGKSKTTQTSVDGQMTNSTVAHPPPPSQTTILNNQLPNADILVSAIAQYLKTHLTMEGLNEPQNQSIDVGPVYKGATPLQTYPPLSYYSQPLIASNMTHPPGSNTTVTSTHSLAYTTQGSLVYNTNIPPGKHPQSSMKFSPHLPPNGLISSASVSGGLDNGHAIQYPGVHRAPSYPDGSMGFYQDNSVDRIGLKDLSYQGHHHNQTVPYIHHYPLHMRDDHSPEVGNQQYGMRQHPQYYSDEDYHRSNTAHRYNPGYQYTHTGTWHGSLNRHPSQHRRERYNDLIDSRYPDMDMREPHPSSPDSPSPSLSKDSGICLTQQGDRHMVQVSQRQSPLFHVLQIIRDYFTRDGIFDTGVEDVVMSEYILSLRSLKWETFCNAVTEKYCHLVWGYTLLHRLYLALSGPTSMPQNQHNTVDVTVKAQLSHQVSTAGLKVEQSRSNEHFNPNPALKSQSLRVESDNGAKPRPGPARFTDLDQEVNATVPASLVNFSNQSHSSIHVGGGAKSDWTGQHQSHDSLHYQNEPSKGVAHAAKKHSPPAELVLPAQRLSFLAAGSEHQSLGKPNPDSSHVAENQQNQSLKNVKSNYPMHSSSAGLKTPYSSANHHTNTYRRPHNRPLRAPSAPVTHSSPLYGDDDVFTEADSNIPAEMRKLSAELFKDRKQGNHLASKRQTLVTGASRPLFVGGQEVLQGPGGLHSQHSDSRRPLASNSKGQSHQESEDLERVNGGQNISDFRKSSLHDVKPASSELGSISGHGFPTKDHDKHREQSSQFLVSSGTEYKSFTDDLSKIDNSNTYASNSTYNRSLSAVYARQPAETGVKVIDKEVHGEANHHRTGSMGSLEKLNGPLLQHEKKSYVVYHSAMIQLSLTPDVNTFINSIDEENKAAILLRMTGIRQEILILRRERKKSQKFYRRLNSNSSVKTAKGDQHVSEKTLKELSDIARKLSFLLLCQTHLQMLLAELNGLDTCFLYSLSACEGSLIFQPCKDNPYLQFRTLTTPDADPMSVLQAGSPRGLMAYLYKSSALSDGYIHQFLVCFRYILTSEQLLNFLLDKCRSSQSSKVKDINLSHVERRSLDLLQYWMEGFYSVDFSLDKRLLSKLVDFLKEQMELNVNGADNLFSLYSACKMGDHSELMLMMEIDEDEDDGDGAYFLHLSSPMRWNSFRSLLKLSKPGKGGFSKSRSEQRLNACTEVQRPLQKFSVSDCPVQILAEQLTLLEQEFFRKCHPVHFLNSQYQGVGVALSMPGLRTPSMSRKSEPSPTKKGLFVGDPVIRSSLVDMITHSHELAHWVSVEILSCGSHKSQVNVLTKFLTVAQMCLNVRNFATALSILDGLENLVVKQLPVWKEVPTKYLSYMNELTNTKIKLKSETTWLMSEKDWHLQPTIPCALYVALQIQQLEIGSFTLANGMYKWDKMRTISEAVDQLRIFRDHEYGFQVQPEVQLSLRRCLSEFSDKDLHVVASTQENNFRRRSSSSSLSGTLKRMKEKFQSMTK